MKSTRILGTAAVLITSVIAYPTVDGLLERQQARHVARTKRDVAEKQRRLDPASGLPDLNPVFDAKTQYVSTSGDHAFVAPVAGDARGPCPGLNAMANHGYLPHNGVANHLQFLDATHTVFGMGADLAGFLTILGGALDGNGLAWSIGGPSDALPGNALLGQPQGISGSHNKYETDVSPARGDLYLYGNDFAVQMSQYQQLYDMAQENNDDIDLALLEEFRSQRYDNSVQNNPYMWMGPFTGVLVSPAAFTFIYRFMGNKSSEYPAGRLNTEVLNSFFGVTKNDDGSLTHTPGHERIPDNWYRRANGDEYTIPFFNSDAVLAILAYPKFGSVGGNMGKPNTFTGLDLNNLTGGAYNAQMLTEGNNLACLASQAVQQAAPDLIRCGSLVGSLTGLLNNMTAAIDASLQGITCPKLTSQISGQFSQFPGYSEVNCATGTYVG